MGHAPHTAIGEFYHIYNRGTEKRDIFLYPSDYERFISLLYISNSTKPIRIDRRRKITLADTLQKPREDTLVDISAYCLMPNHFHILVYEKEESGISKFMQKLSTGYAMYFNTKYDRSGNLFQGKYKARHVDTDIYLRYIIAYIHLNPLKLIDPHWKEKGIRDREEGKRFLESYYYSSFIDFTRKKRPEKQILQQHVLPEYFETEEDFKIRMYEWIDMNPFE